MKNKFMETVVLLIAMFSFNCEDNPSSPPQINPQENITTVRLKFVNENNFFDTIIVNWKDENGDGSNIYIDTLKFPENFLSYNGSIEILDESKSPISNLTFEIEEEKNNHMFVYERDSALYNDIKFDSLNTDDNGKPFGLHYKVFLTPTFFKHTKHRKIKVSLRHFAEGKDENLQNYETDVEVEFPIQIGD